MPTASSPAPGPAPLPGRSVGGTEVHVSNVPNVVTDTPTNTDTVCGPTWTVVASPDRGTQQNFLKGVSAVSANDIWAAGYSVGGTFSLESGSKALQYRV